MAVNDICADIAALLTPMPSPPDHDTARDSNVDEDAYQDVYNDLASEAWQERESFAEALRFSWEEEDADPLLSTLADLRKRRLRLEADMRLLMAYGRCFTHPRPYKLIDLANAAGLSISGVRIAFDDDEITQAAEILDRPPAHCDGPAPAAT
jgi:hypothetical protein